MLWRLISSSCNSMPVWKCMNAWHRNLTLIHIKCSESWVSAAGAAKMSQLFHHYLFTIAFCNLMQSARVGQAPLLYIEFSIFYPHSFAFTVNELMHLKWSAHYSNEIIIITTTKCRCIYELHKINFMPLTRAQFFFFFSSCIFRDIFCFQRNCRLAAGYWWWLVCCSVE